MKLPITVGCSEHQCRDLNSIMTNVSYNVGDIIYKRDDAPEYMYILLKGAL